MTPAPTPEQDVLPLEHGLADALRCGDVPPGEGAYAPLETAGWFAGYPVGGTNLVALRNAVWSPESGVVLTAAGHVAAATAAQVPMGQMKSAVARLRARSRSEHLPMIERAALWYPAGAANYGHFLFDALPGLEALSKANLLSLFPPMTPSLRPWQAEAVRLVGHGPLCPFPKHEAVRVGTLVYATTLDHYLHRHGNLFTSMLRRLQPTPAALSMAPDCLYLVRPRLSARQLVGEDVLIRQLQERGVTILDPSRLSLTEQIAAFSRANTIIGPSGAAFANMAFLPRGARVIEIRPEPMGGAWIGLTAARLGLNHVLIPAGPPLRLRDLPLRVAAGLVPRWLAGRYAYACRIDPGPVLAALDKV